MPGLRELAESDLSIIMEGDTYGPGWPITVTDPVGVTQSLKGLSSDISQLIDPDTGQAVSGRLATVAIRIQALIDVGLSLPVGIADITSKPWVIQFDDINGNPYTFKVVESNPDRALGIVACILETYNVA